MNYNKKTALIFAAGLGTRLKPLTDTKPKALVEVLGKPMLQIAIEKLIDSGCRRIVINAHHFAEQIFDFVDKNKFGVDIFISHEKEQLLDTGGGIYFARELIGNNPFIAYNVDIISNIDLKKLYDCHSEDNLATIVVSDRKTSRYLTFDENNILTGWENIQTGQVKTPYSSAFISNHRRLAFNGIHVISPKIFELMEGRQGAFSITDFYLSVCHKENIVAYQQDNLEAIDIGKIEQLKRFNNKL